MPPTGKSCNVLLCAPFLATRASKGSSLPEIPLMIHPSLKACQARLSKNGRAFKPDSLAKSRRVFEIFCLETLRGGIMPVISSCRQQSSVKALTAQ
ncbi:hypothetical protein M378DRAFT_270849 [Amanita muscaria Koide BX008]|uniref:Uncharacterized protein n=1 Tax=Amanita muscaria (strain Koide BX008) TaxID=946122 RepID=A0A0C2SW28_AMAMK|nr:hypothetical protein M378DRAFT_270849 [Amanita muscaria Koide BX008]